MEIVINENGALVILIKNWLQQYLGGYYTVSQIYNILANQINYIRPEIKVHNYKGPTPRDQAAFGDQGVLTHKYTGIEFSLISWDTDQTPIAGIKDIRDWIIND